jgi:hypothetical protein
MVIAQFSKMVADDSRFPVRFSFSVSGWSIEVHDRRLLKPAALGDDEPDRRLLASVRYTTVPFSPIGTRCA